MIGGHAWLIPHCTRVMDSIGLWPSWSDNPDIIIVVILIVVILAVVILVVVILVVVT